MINGTHLVRLAQGAHCGIRADGQRKPSRHDAERRACEGELSGHLHATREGGHQHAMLRGVPVRASSVATCMQLGRGGISMQSGACEGELSGHLHATREGSGAISMQSGGGRARWRSEARRVDSQRQSVVTKKVTQRGTPRGNQWLLEEALGGKSRALVRNGRQGCSPRKAPSPRRDIARALRAVDEG